MYVIRNNKKNVKIYAVEILYTEFSYCRGYFPYYFDESVILNSIRNAPNTKQSLVYFNILDAPY